VLFFVDFGQNPHALFMLFFFALLKAHKKCIHFLKKVYTLFVRFLRAHKKRIKSEKEIHKKCKKKCTKSA
jgi:hypothetical protein